MWPNIFQKTQHNLSATNYVWLQLVTASAERGLFTERIQVPYSKAGNKLGQNVSMGQLAHSLPYKCSLSIPQAC